MKQTRKLDGKVAVITGGNSGIGLATAKLFAAEGASVAILGRDQKTIDATLESLPGEKFGFRGDVTSLDELSRFFKAVTEKFGKIDTLFVNAGIAKTSAIEATSEEFYDELFDINVRGAFFTVQKALPHMKDGGTIVVTTSVVNHLGGAQSAVYSGTKAALRSFVQCFAAELLPRRIRVNCVSPGPTETPIMAKGGVGEKALTDLKVQLAKMIPMKRMGKPEEAAKAVLFLAGEDSSYTNGSEIMVDGGWTEIK